MQSLYLPIHMTDTSIETDFAHISVRTPGTPIGRGSLRIGRGKYSFTVPGNAPEAARQTAALYEDGFAWFAGKGASQPVVPAILRGLGEVSLQVEFANRNDRVARLFPPSRPSARGQLVLDATWAGSNPDGPAVHFAGIILLGTLSMLGGGTDQRRAMHRVFDLYGMLDEDQKAKLQGFLRSASVDCGHVMANALASACDARLAQQLDGLDLDRLAHVPTETLFDVGHRLDRIRFSRQGSDLRHAVVKLLRDRCGAGELAKPRAGESPLALAQRALDTVERTLKWRDRWATWMRGQDRVDFPYDQDLVLDLLNEEQEDVDAWRASINEVISRTFDYDTEGQNIRRISEWAYENDILLVAGRLSRAFGNQANLLTTARYIRDKESLVPLAARLERAARNYPGLHTAATLVLHLVQEQKRTPYARLVGALNAFDESLVQHQGSAARKILEEADAASRHLLSRRAVDLTRERVAAEAAVADRLLALSARLRKQLDATAKDPAAYVLQLQRLHPGEAVNMANANAFREVHSGKEEDLIDLLRQGGDHLYSCPGPGRYLEDGQTRDTHWIIRVSDWIEAIPLFIKERVIRREVQMGTGTTEVEQIQTEVDQEAMEGFFRIHAEFWARNLDEVMASERVSLARQLLVERNTRLAGQAAALLHDSPAMGREEAARQVLKEAPRLHPAVPQLAALVEASEDPLIEDIHRLVEVEGVPRRQALRRVLCEGGSTGGSNLVGKVLAEAEKKGPFPAAVARVFDRQSAAVKQKARALEGISLQRTRPVSSLHVLTTESAGMTEGYVQTWLEEEMALYNVVRASGLEDEVDREQAAYRRRMYEIGRKVIDELGMAVVVDEVMADQRLTPEIAVGMVVGSYRPVADAVALLGVLLEAGGDPEATLDTAPIRDLARVEDYLREHQAELEAAGLPQVAASNGRAFEQRLAEVRESQPDVDLDAAQRLVVNQEADYQEELASAVRTGARRQVFLQLAAEHPELDLEARERTFLRAHSQLARSTARKRVLARHQLNARTSDPRFYYQATGGNKRYNLLYTPSRVNLGHRERDSVVKWRQWVGGADAAAAQAGFEFYSLVNEGGVEERPALAYAEIQKTSENGLAVTHFAGSNALGLLCNAVLEGDAQDMADQMNLREDRRVPPAGEGYGGYCVPKDGLFLAFVLSLTNDVKLRQMGVPDHLHQTIVRLARQALLRKGDFETELDWQQWAAEKLLHYEVLEEHVSRRDDKLVFHIAKIARALEDLGRPWEETAPGHRLIANLAADWSVAKMVVNAEQVNRFMVFHKAWSIYDALRQAREKSPACPADDAARISLSAEYKPVQDVRFSTGLRLFEIFARTGAHLHYALDEEGQNLVQLMFEGFDPDSEEPVTQRAARQVLHTFDVARDDDAAMARFRAAFPGHRPPADLVVTSVTLSSTNDMLFYTSDARLDEIANQAQVELADFGLTEDQIRTNAEVYGGNLRQWAGVSSRPQEQVEQLLERLSGSVHALVLKLRGPGRDYERDVQGVDVLNTGIPFPQLLELLQDPPKLVALMRQGNPNSSLVIADGCAGREPRALTDYDIQAFFAACEAQGRRGTYVATGLGQRNVDRLEEEMHIWRGRAQQVLEAVSAVAAAGARRRRAAVARAVEVYADIQRALIDGDAAGQALRVEEKLRRSGKWKERDAAISQARVKLASGLPLGRLDAGTWIAGLGGCFALMGEAPGRVEELLTRLEEGPGHIAAASGDGETSPAAPFSAAEIDTVRSLLVRPAYEPDPARFTQQKLVESSSKAVEIAAVEALERRQALRVRAEKARAMADRESGFRDGAASLAGAAFGPCEQRARAAMGELLERVQAFDPERPSAPEERTEINRLFGRLIACVRAGLTDLAARLASGPAGADGAEVRAVLEHIDRVYTGREIVLEDWKLLAGGYEDRGDLARLAEAADGDPDKLDQVTRGMELFYVTLALAQTLQFAIDDRERIDVRLFSKGLTDFFAETINDHWYEYRPWVFDRGTAFGELTSEELFALAGERHRWLYQYLRTVLVRCTDLRDRTPEELDALLGRMDDEQVVTGIGAGAGSETEARWRAYNQLREISFMHSDGFAAPPVFTEFDPELIAADERVNVVFLYPVGRTHVSRALREGPTLNGELEREGRPGANLLITRHGTSVRFPGVDREQLAIEDAHLYVDRDTLVAALQRCKGLDAAAAEAQARTAEADGSLTPKGIRIAVRFARAGRPVQIPVGSLIPFHGVPVYQSGRTEDLGIPATVQSLVFSDITYDKSLYPQIFGPDSGVRMPPEMDWRQEYGEGKSPAQIRRAMIEGLPGEAFDGLARFARQYPIVLIKGAAESGARNLKVFELQDDAGQVDRAGVDAAAEFLYDVSRRQNVVVQTAILTSPEFWAAPGLMQSFVERQILEWNTPVVRDHLPRSQIYGSLRIVATSPHPDAPYEVAFPIALSSLQVATNVGRGGTLEKLVDDFVHDAFRAEILPGLREEARKVMAAMARFAGERGEDFAASRHRAVGADARGVSYAWPPYLMLDYLVSPVFSKPGRLVDIEPEYDDEGRQTGSRPILQDETGRFPAQISSWHFIHLEPNVGIGLWDRFNLREQVLEEQACEREERPFSWDRVGTSDRIVLRNFAIAGQQYLEAIRSSG